MDPVIPVNILTVLVIVLVIGPLAWLLLRWADRKFEARRARQMERARERTRRMREQGSSGYPWGQPSLTDDCGDQGGVPLPAPADYSDEVTDEHLKRMAALVDQRQFDSWQDDYSGDGDKHPIEPRQSHPKAPHTGCGLPVGGGDTAAGWQPERDGPGLPWKAED